MVDITFIAQRIIHAVREKSCDLFSLDNIKFCPACELHGTQGVASSLHNVIDILECVKGSKADVGKYPAFD